MRGTEDIVLGHNVVRGAVCISASLFFVQVTSLLDTLDIEIFVHSLGSGWLTCQLELEDMPGRGVTPTGKSRTQQSESSWDPEKPVRSDS